MGRWIDDWNPEDEEFWGRKGKLIARRNLVFSIFAEFLGFAVWVIWSVVAVNLNKAGFHFSTGQLFTLVAVPALVGATARFPYTLAVPRFGGRNWTVVSALLLLIPLVFLVFIVSNPGTPYWLLLLGAATAGLGGGNFASSMANISFFYPDRRKGLALGLNAAGGNLGVAVAQLVTPLAVTAGSIGFIASDGKDDLPRLQNAGLIWIPFVVAAAACAWMFMDNLKVSRSPIRDQAVIVKRDQTWIMSWLYIGTFGSFIGYSAGLPLLMKTQFPEATLSLAFLGPMVGSISRPVGGWLADKLGGAKVTFATFLLMIVAVLGVILALSYREAGLAFQMFLGAFVVLFLLTGIGNGSTYRMIPMIFRATHRRLAEGKGEAAEQQAMAAARRETAAAVGFIGAVGAYGGWLIPQGYGVSAALTGSPMAALYSFIAFYGTCLGLTWWYYLRRNFAVDRSPSLAWAEV